MDRDIRDAVLRLERIGEETRRCFKRDYRCDSWFEDWDAMPETTRGADALEDKKRIRLWLSGRPLVVGSGDTRG